MYTKQIKQHNTLSLCGSPRCYIYIYIFFFFFWGGCIFISLSWTIHLHFPSLPLWPVNRGQVVRRLGRGGGGGEQKTNFAGVHYTGSRDNSHIIKLFEDGETQETARARGKRSPGKLTQKAKEGREKWRRYRKGKNKAEKVFVCCCLS